MGRIQEVSQLLSKPEFSPLRPLLLLLGWDVYVAEGSGKALTEALWPSPVCVCVGGGGGGGRGVCVCVCVRICACVRERGREGDTVSACV